MGGEELAGFDEPGFFFLGVRLRTGPREIGPQLEFFGDVLQCVGKIEPLSARR